MQDPKTEAPVNRQELAEAIANRLAKRIWAQIQDESSPISSSFLRECVIFLKSAGVSLDNSAVFNESSAHDDVLRSLANVDLDLLQ